MFKLRKKLKGRKPMEENNIVQGDFKPEEETQEEEKTEQKVTMSPPWITYVNEIGVMFGQDPEIEKILYDNENYTLKIHVSNPLKAAAIEKLLPAEKEFGAVNLKVSVIPANTEMTDAQIYNTAFAGNPVFAYTKTAQLFNNPITYVVFKKEVVQFFNDDLSDAHGVKSTLYQYLAKDLFNESNGVFFNTDTPGLRTPENWPNKE